MKFVKWSLVALFLGCVSAHAANLVVPVGADGITSHGQHSVSAGAQADGKAPAQAVETSRAERVAPVTECGGAMKTKRPAHAVVQRRPGNGPKQAIASTVTRAYWARLEAHTRIQQNMLYAFRRAQQSGSFAASDSINHRYLTYG